MHSQRLTRWFWGLLLGCFMGLIWLSPRLTAQETTPWIITPHTHSALYAGAGDTFLTKGIVINPGVEVRLIARNRIGNWLRIQRGDPQNPQWDGWVMRGYFNLPSEIRFSDVPIDETTADGDPTYLASETQKVLAQMPVIPPLKPLMQLVYETGQTLGNNPQGVIKVGDSVMANPQYLKPFSQPDVALGAYDYLAETVAFYGQSLATESVSAQVGMTTYVIFDPLWANVNPNCLPNESPLTCEVRLKKPSVAFILFGANDVKHMTFEQFGVQMRQIVQETLNAGVIPVLSTFSARPEYELYAQVMRFNLELVAISQEYSVPLINLWLAARPLPDYGLDIDGIHMLQTGFSYIKLDSGMESWYGVALQNLLAIRMLDEIRRTLDLSLPAN